MSSVYAAYGVYDVNIAKYRENMLVGMCGFDKSIGVEDNIWASKVKFPFMLYYTIIL